MIPMIMVGPKRPAKSAILEDLGPQNGSRRGQTPLLHSRCILRGSRAHRLTRWAPCSFLPFSPKAGVAGFRVLLVETRGRTRSTPHSLCGAYVRR